MNFYFITETPTFGGGERGGGEGEGRGRGGERG